MLSFVDDSGTKIHQDHMTKKIGVFFSFSAFSAFVSFLCWNSHSLNSFPSVHNRYRIMSLEDCMNVKCN